ncbi:unnamed protein product [Discosporangium mesarthrocarpum]
MAGKVPQSKALTQMNKNRAFSRELCKDGSSLIPRCPSGLRSHFLGLQSFQYDYGA